MVKPNWDIFKAKFSENTQDNFEWFCYILFCKEFKQEKGIFRFKNQSAIKTNPVEHGNDVIGWQAKFYDTPLSNHKKELLQTLEKAKRDYPDITKIILYTNQEWGQNKGQKPQGLVEIERKANELKIDLEQRTTSFFESPFVSVDNEIVAKHFFINDKSILDIIEEQKLHTENILTEIQTNIVFKKQFIEIDRNNELKKIKTTEQKVIVLSGTAGVGKTALIKNLWEEAKKEMPFYLFKATEFDNLRTVNDFFKNFNFQDFIDAHKEDNRKIIIIDSAEKLVDLKNIDPFKEFLSILIENNWKIIFTTRDNYLGDLNYQFFEIYKIAPLNINLQNLEQTELNSLTDKYSFQLPQDEKLLELIKNPFYLKEYLKYYQVDKTLNYKGFKDELWYKNIKKSKTARSECFLKMAVERANQGSFFVIPVCESAILDNELIKDGILGYEDDKGYFITHDIYEEWALEKFINREFLKKENNQKFFKAIGQSLPIRRSFRNWVSEQLLLKNNDIKIFIAEVISGNSIDESWKNEILVAVLLSDYSDYFFDNFKNTLLENNQKLLKKATFWLRIACKEVDEDFFKQLGIKNVDLSILKYVLTKPKGNGWKSIIEFVFDNLDAIGIENIYFILPIIHDWNNKFKTGETTKLSSLIALQYYQWTIEKDVYFYRDENVKAKLLQTILYGASEIKDELIKVFKEILKNKWKNHREPYYFLSKTILTKIEGISVSRVLPKYVLQLADLFWTHTPKKDRWYSDSRMGVEQYFGIEDNHLEYYPASAYQTPIYWLLQSSLKETIDFILSFTNKTVENFAKSEFAKYEVEETEVFLDEKTTIKQYISNRLWCTYRGTQVSPHVLESMHMALEKFFLENGKAVDSKILEGWLVYLLRNSKSASISAVVVSVVLAFPDKTFNVAKVLFQTKKFFLYETSRLVLDQGHKSQLLMLKNNFGVNSKNDIHENERLKACDDKHRKWHLENLFLQYQVFRNESISEEEVQERRKELWKILDRHYKQLPKKSEQTEADKTWRMFLARMDYRKMKPTTKKIKNGIEIHWNPKIDPQLKKESEESLKKNSKPMEYTSLKMWAYYRMKNDDKYKEYYKYEKSPKLALKEVQKIISKLKAIKKPQNFQLEHTKEEVFYLLNHSIPGDVCSVLIRDYFDKLSQKEIALCKDIVLEIASSSLKPNYQYQISDGVQSAISVLPVLLNKFPKEKGNIKTILLLTLFDEYPIGMGGGRFNHYSINAIHKLWKDNFKDAQSLLLGYLLLKPKYEELRKKLREENHEKEIYELHETQVIEKFSEEYKSDLQKILENKITLKDCGNIREIKLSSLRTAFQLIPLKTENEDHKKIVKEIVSSFAEKLTSDDRDDKIDYMVRHDFFEKLAYFVLSAAKEEIQDYIKPFLDKFNTSEAIADLFKEFIFAEDYLNSYENFWEVWNLFKGKIVEICKKGDGYWYVGKIIKSYLFAQNPWKESVTEWHTLKENDKNFFKEISEKIGHCSSALYAISKLLNDIGSFYLDDGILWLSDMLSKNKNFSTVKLETNTVYYVENLVRKYIYKNRETIRRNKNKKKNVLVILDFLVENGSVVGYILRENVL